MKKIISSLLAIPFIILSCSNEESVETTTSENYTHVVEIPSKSLLYDEIYEIRDGREIDITNTQNWTEATSTHEFYEMTVMAQPFIFVGSVLASNSVNKGAYKPIGSPNVWKKECVISYSLPVHSQKIAIGRSATENAVKDAVGDRNFSEQQSQLFTYKMKEFSYYSELKLAFGSNVNIGQLFNVTTSYNQDRITKKSGLFIDFSQIYFSIYMDVPDDGNIFIDENVRQKFLKENPVYVNTLNYGRKGVIMVESDSTYEQVSLAVRAAFKAKIVNGKLNISVEEERALRTAQIQICIIGGDGDRTVKTVEGFDKFQELIVNAGVYTKTVYGAPISFSAVHAEDNSMFVTQFQVKHD